MNAHTPQYVCSVEPPSIWKEISEALRATFILKLFVYRDLKVRYQHTALGVLWNIIQPLALMIIFSVFLSILFKGTTNSVPAPVFTFCALCMWQFFSRMISQGGACLTHFGDIMHKVYFPKLLAPLSLVLGAGVDFLVSLSLLGILLVLYQVNPGVQLFYMPLFVIGLGFFGLGLAYWFSGLVAQYKDVIHIVPLLVQTWVFMCPVMYPVSIIPERYMTFYLLNPVAVLIEGFRWSMTNGNMLPPVWSLVWAGLFIAAILITGIRYYIRVSGTLVDQA